MLPNNCERRLSETTAIRNGGQRERQREEGLFIKAKPFADSSDSRLLRWPPFLIAAALSIYAVSVQASSNWPHEPAGSTRILDWPFTTLTGADAVSGRAINMNPTANAAIVSNPNGLTAPASPPSALQITYPAGFVSGSAPAVFYVNPGNKTQYFTGLWWMADSNWEGEPSGVNKILFWNDTAAASQDIQMFGSPGGPYKLCFFQEQSTSSFGRFCGSSPNITLGTWHQIEVFMKHSTTSTSGDGIAMLWLDGQLIVNITNMNYDTSHPITEPQISPTWGGNTGAAKTRSSFYWIDQWYLSDPGNNLPPSGSGDTTSPSAPTGASATAASATQINLSYPASTDNVGVTGYKIYSCSGASCTPSLSATLGNVTSYNHTGLTASTLYRYQISALDSAGNESTKSTLTSATTQTPPAGPNAPTNLQSSTLSAPASDTQAGLSWTASTSAGITGYNLYRCVSNNGVQAAATCTPTLIRSLGNVTSTTDTGLVPQTGYTYAVTAVNGSGESALSGSRTVTTTHIGIAAAYPGDANIQTNSNVKFVERFTQGSVAGVVSNWGDVLNQARLSLDSADKPANSSNPALVLASDGNSATHLYKNLAPALNGTDTYYLRYYVKYQAGGQYHHTSIWMGGYAPALSFPFPRAGCQPSSNVAGGNQLFSASLEPVGTKLDSYLYWLGMHGANDTSCNAAFACPEGVAAGNRCYWGNETIQNPAIALDGNWHSVEVMVKLNTPVTASNGEVAYWLDGVKVEHLGQGFPNGTWTWGLFQPGSGTPFSGFQWRTDTALPINYLWMQNYSSSGSATTMKVANVVLSNTYVGPLAAAASGSSCDLNNDTATNVADVQLCVNQAIGTTACGTGDINRDSACNVIDVQRVVNAVLGGQCVTQ